MANNWTEAQISEIVASVLKQINGSALPLPPGTQRLTADVSSSAFTPT